MAEHDGKKRVLAKTKAEPFDPDTARTYARGAIESGGFDLTTHALEKMEKDGLQVGDILNVIRGGWCEFSEERQGTWRYRFTTNRMCVVLTFRSTSRIVVVTTWRIP
jgi:hypothetical protein